MWYINSRIEGIVLRRKARDFFCSEDRQRRNYISNIKENLPFTEIAAFI